MSCGVSRRHGSDLALLSIWHRPVATALITLAWKPPYAAGAALEKAKRQKKKKKKETLRFYVFKRKECKYMPGIRIQKLQAEK